MSQLTILTLLTGREYLLFVYLHINERDGMWNVLNHGAKSGVQTVRETVMEIRLENER